MLSFSTVKGIHIPEGDVVKITRVSDQAILWQAFIEAVLSGTSPLSLPNAVDNNIIYLKQYGKCEQNGTPTPSVPVDIKCNNGKLKVVDDELPDGYRRLIGINFDGNVFYDTGMRLYGSDTLKFKFKASTACNVLGCYTSASAQTNYSLYVGTSTATYLRYNGGSYNSRIDANDWYDVTITPTGSQGMKTDSSWTAKSFTTDSDLLIGTTSYGATSAKLTGALEKNVVVLGRETIIPCERVSDGELGYYMKSANRFLENQGAGTPTSLGYDTSHLVLVVEGRSEILRVAGKNLNEGTVDNKGYTSTGGTSNSSTFAGTLCKIQCQKGDKFTVSWGNFPDGVSGVFVNTWKVDGTWNTRQAISASTSLTYTIGDGIGEVNFTLYKTGGVTIGENAWIQVELGNTPTSHEPYSQSQNANVQNLFGVGNYKDEQDIISGVITRRCGVKVLDGKENVGVSNATFTIAIGGRVSSKTPLICSHFEYSTKTSSQVEDLKVISFSSTNIGFRYDACANTTAFKTWLANQYEAGTPVIVIYPLATETTEQVTPQQLSTAQGTNVVTAIAEVSDVELEVKYTKL